MATSHWLLVRAPHWSYYFEASSSLWPVALSLMSFLWQMTSTVITCWLGLFYITMKSEFIVTPKLVIEPRTSTLCPWAIHCFMLVTYVVGVLSFGFKVLANWLFTICCWSVNRWSDQYYFQGVPDYIQRQISNTSVNNSYEVVTSLCRVLCLIWAYVFMKAWPILLQFLLVKMF